MRRWAAVALLALAACRAPAPAKPAGPEGAPAPPEAPGPQAIMQGKTSLYLYDADPATGTQGKPRLEIRDTEVSLQQQGEKPVWSFKDAHAIIYAEDGTETHLRAGQGYLNEESQEAVLSGGVTMAMGQKTIRLEDIAWSNRMAKSDKPIQLRDGESEIDASSLEYNPDTKELILKDARGTLNYADTAAEAAPPAEVPAPGGEERSTNP